MKLGQQQDGFLLAGLGDTMAAADHFPGLAQGPAAVQQADHQVGGG